MESGGQFVMTALDPQMHVLLVNNWDIWITSSMELWGLWGKEWIVYTTCNRLFACLQEISAIANS